MSNYRPSIKVKKWWWPLFINALNMATMAAWRLHSTVRSTFGENHFVVSIFVGRKLNVRKSRSVE